MTENHEPTVVSQERPADASAVDLATPPASYQPSVRKRVSPAPEAVVETVEVETVVETIDAPAVAQSTPPEPRREPDSPVPVTHPEPRQAMPAPVTSSGEDPFQALYHRRLGRPFRRLRRQAQPILSETQLDRLNQPIQGDYLVAMLSLKGGVGKTTTTVGLGATFASLRGDRVIAVDANPDLGTLGQRVPQQTDSTVRDLIADRSIERFSDVRAHTSQARSRLEVLASERDPAMAESFSDEEYREATTVLRRYYNIILTDCGTGLSHSVMKGVLALADAVILVTSPALDGARSADATLDWLQAHGYEDLVSNAILVVSHSRPGSKQIAKGRLAGHFLTKCRAVHEIPYDNHLAEGGVVDLDRLQRSTYSAFVSLGMLVADDMARPRRTPQAAR
ncbi:MinD/ParA family protein [Gordonia sp. X0973]|uniref:MinD/ParA family ATP-binding protein n=1 Tax=Gordonia sp. X0973 TaxID=2742602 RepID=UPI000F540F8B|nr:MinD/ParA family protein [Gordonia sp. X0973]QKT08313.1 MinD/ParA family protein [Gordonia sp. X0973]